VIRKEAWFSCKTSSSVCLCWELDEPQGPTDQYSVPEVVRWQCVSKSIEESKEMLRDDPTTATPEEVSECIECPRSAGRRFPGATAMGGVSVLSFARVAAVLSEAVEHYFPAGCGVTVIAEPGRYMITASHTYATAVIAKRQLTAADHAAAVGVEVGVEAPQKEEAEVALYINDGVYGCFNCVVFDHATVTPRAFPSAARGLVGTKLFGPTCDSIDVVMSCAALPPLTIGEWLWFDNMGAYTRCAASRFNGQGKHAVHYVWSGMP